MLLYNRCYLLSIQLGIGIILIFLVNIQVAVAGNIQPVTSGRLIGKTVVIDPGHGGSDPGTVGYHGTLEKNLTLLISKRLAGFFEQSGARVILTRTRNQNVADAQSPDLAQRVAIANNPGADILLSIHLNHFFDHTEYGAQVFYQYGSSQSKKLAEAIQVELNSLLVDSGRKALAGDFYLCRNSRMPAVIVEVGFLSHPEEEMKLNDPEYQSRAAWAVYRGVVNYFNS